MEPMYVYDEEKNAVVKRAVTFVPGLYKIFDEILGKYNYLPTRSLVHTHMLSASRTFSAFETVSDRYNHALTFCLSKYSVLLKMTHAHALKSTVHSESYVAVIVTCSCIDSHPPKADIHPERVSRS